MAAVAAVFAACRLGAVSNTATCTLGNDQSRRCACFMHKVLVNVLHSSAGIPCTRARSQCWLSAGQLSKACEFNASCSVIRIAHLLATTPLGIDETAIDIKVIFGCILQGSLRQHS